LLGSFGKNMLFLKAEEENGRASDGYKMEDKVARALRAFIAGSLSQTMGGMAAGPHGKSLIQLGIFVAKLWDWFRGFDTIDVRMLSKPRGFTARRFPSRSGPADHPWLRSSHHRTSNGF
jgi:hypothetical protein